MKDGGGDSTRAAGWIAATLPEQEQRSLIVMPLMVAGLSKPRWLRGLGGA